MLIGTGNSGNNSQEFFKGLYDFFDSHPNVTLVARNSGSASASGDVGYWNQPGPFKTNAWAVFRFEPTLLRSFPVYVQIQLAMGSDFGTAPGSPGVIENGGTVTGVGIQCAIGVGGDADPYRGTKNAGVPNDTRADPIWGIPTGGTACHVFPRSNNGAGAHTASKNNFTLIGNPGTSSCRYHVVADDDSFTILMDVNDDNSFAAYYAGTYERRADLPQVRNFVCFGSFGSALPFTIGSQYGTTAGTGLQGGMIFLDEKVRGVGLDRLQSIVGTALQPSFATEVDEYPIPVYASEASEQGVIAVGLAGYVSFVRETANVATNDTNADFTVAAFGPSTTATVKTVVPWSGVAAPKATSTREGTTFSRTRTEHDT